MLNVRFERWADLVSEARGLRKEISEIASDYDDKGKTADPSPEDKTEEREKVKSEELA